MSKEEESALASKRLDDLLEELGYNPTSMANEIGVLPQRIRDVLKGKTKEISPDLASKILSCFPSVNRVWLITGDGEMFSSHLSQHVNGDNNTVAGRDISTFQECDLSELVSVIGKQNEIISELTLTVSRQQQDISKLLAYLTKSTDK